ncbi:MAG: ABC-2 type transporter [Methanocella sp. PtaU1.Bin125]|nr:MAG: ABC-2 type transporter [Methanocella sp. PtaU1.Bin125]
MKSVYEYFLRDLKKWLRGRVFVLTALIMPAAWLVFVGMALPTRFTDNYVGFITPGILVMTMLFSSFQGGSLMIFDKVLGFMNKFLALPSPRESILFGKIAFITFRGLLQATVILALAVLLGVRLPGIAELVFIYLTLGVFGVLGAATATTIALKVDDHDGYAAVNSMISMPLFFASSALMPYRDMPEWLRVLASMNPVSFATDTVRSMFSGTIEIGGIAVLAVLGLIVLGVSTYMFRQATV